MPVMPRAPVRAPSKLRAGLLAILVGLEQSTWPHCLTMVVSGVTGDGDVLSPSPTSLAAHFLPVGNCAREMQNFFLQVGKWPIFSLTTCLPMC